jgi:hypothetical protein
MVDKLKNTNKSINSMNNKTESFEHEWNNYESMTATTYLVHEI